jgi:hypothetical protein
MLFAILRWSPDN